MLKSKLIRTVFILVLIVQKFISPVLAQVPAFQKYGAGYVGDLPKPHEFRNDAKLDGIDYQTGTLQISIPLYVIKSGTLELPLILQYNANGIREGQQGSIAGVGWEISVGGKIVHNVIGIADDGSNGMNTVTQPWENYPINTGSLNLDSYSNKQYAIDVNSSDKDGAHDTYNFELPNCSGAFISKNGQTYTYPYQPDVVVTNGGNTLSKNGINYNFIPGDIRSSMKRSFYTEVYPPDTPNYTLNWGAKEIISKDRNLSLISSQFRNDSITFSYQTFSSTIQSHLPILNAYAQITTSATLPMSKKVNKNFSTGAWTEEDMYLVKEPILYQNKTYYKQLTRIKYIYFEGGRAVFNYTDPQYKIIANITIEKKNINNNYELYQQIVFQPVTSTDSNVDFPFLQSVEHKDKDGNRISFYYFDYYHWERYSSKERSGIDRWGFYNGEKNNTIMIENPDSTLALTNKRHSPIYDKDGYTATQYIPNTSRESHYLYGQGVGVYRNRLNYARRSFNFDYAKSGTLQAVITPFGGVYKYVYEPHQFMHFMAPQSGNTYIPRIMHGGGFRIKEITVSDNLAEGGTVSMKKTFKYGTNGLLGSGIYDGMGAVSYPKNLLGATNVYPGSSGIRIGNRVQNLLLLSHSAGDLSLKGGSYACYAVVKEELYEKKDNVSYETTYDFFLPPQDEWQSSSVSTTLNIPTGDLSPGVSKAKFYHQPKSIRKYSGGSRQYIDFKYKEIKNPNNSGNNPLRSAFSSTTGVLAAPFMEGGYTYYFDENGDFKTDYWENVINFKDPYSSYVRGKDDPDLDFPGKYIVPLVNLLEYSNNYVATDEVTTHFSENSDFLRMDSVKYEYSSNNSHLNPVKILRLNGDNEWESTYIRYPLDQSNAIYSSGYYLAQKGLINTGFQQILTKKKVAQEFMFGGSFDKYALSSSGSIYLSEQVNFKPTFPIIYDANIFNTSNSSVLTSYSAKSVDNNANVLEYEINQAKKNSLIWGYNNKRIISSISNAGYSDVAYTGFEQIEKGNWAYQGSRVNNLGSMTGNYAYNLTTGTISKSNLNPSVTYHLIYWQKDGGTSSVSGGAVQGEIILLVKNGWKLKKNEIKGASVVTLTGTGLIDDIKIYPKDAEMSTYTFSDLEGIDSVTQPNGNFQHFNYDGAGRLRDIIDIDKNIRERYRYHLGF